MVMKSDSERNCLTLATIATFSPAITLTQAPGEGSVKILDLGFGRNNARILDVPWRQSY